MSLKHAILVLLDREPGSGYDLTQRFNQGIGHFWQASHQQIYQQLKKLDGDNLVQFALEEQSGKPDRKVYKITAEGKAALQHWLHQDDKPPVVRDALLIKLFASQAEDIEAMISELDRHIDIHKKTILSHQEIEAQFFSANKKQQLKMRNQYLTLRRGIRYEREWIDWLEETKELLTTNALPTSPA